MAAPAPVFIQRAFAIDADPSDRNPIPNAPVGQQRASLQLGFPPLTMLPVVAGGRPMLGPDMNGILYMLSSHTVYQQSGEPYHFSAAVAAAIGGYKIGTLLGSVDGSTLWYNIVGNNSTDPDNVATAAGWVAMYAYGMTTLAGLNGGIRILNSFEASKSVIVASGALATNQQIVLPPQQRRWLIANGTTGPFTFQVRTPAGTGVLIPQGGLGAPVEVYSDGINIYNVVAPVNLPIDQAATPLTIAQRTNAGYLFATYFNQSSPLENLAASAIYFDIGDGYHRKIAPANLAAQMPVSWFAGQVSNAQVPQSAVTQHAAAVLSNPALTGNATAPTPPPGTNNSQVATTAFVAGLTSVGVGQNWVITGKVKNVTYTNTTGRAIEVALNMGVQQGTNFQVYVNGVQIYTIGNGSSAANEIPCSFIVPPGATYLVTGSAGLNRWSELT